MAGFSFRTLFVSFAIVLFWIFVMSVFLFSPHIVKLFRKEKSLTIFTFPMLIDAQYLSKFEKETGIKLYISYYESNEELLVKMRETKGRGYDIVIPSDYAVEILTREQLLQKIDKRKLPFWDTIDQRFLGHYFDPENEYSIPYLWEVYQIGINKAYFKKGRPEASWGLVFDQEKAPKKIGMINNAREAILIAAFYLFGEIENITSERIEKIKKLLLKQKKWVEAYTDLRSDYLLLSGAVPVAVGMSGEIWHATRFEKNLDFLIPKEGTFMVIDNIGISARSKKQDLAHTFIQYLYTPEVMSHHADKYSVFPVTTNVTLSDYFICSMQKIWKEAKKLEFFRNVLSEKQLNEVWIELKAN